MNNIYLRDFSSNVKLMFHFIICRTLTHRELPFPPENVQAQRLAEPNQRTVKLSWTASFDGNSPILKYIVQRREVSEIGKLNTLFSLDLMIYLPTYSLHVVYMNLIKNIETSHTIFITGFSSLSFSTHLLCRNLRAFA